MDQDALARLRAAYSPETFRERGHAVIDRLADYLERIGRGDGPVLPWRSPDEAARAWSLDGQARRDLPSLISEVVAAAHHLHHPRYIGHQVAAPLPDAALCDLTSSLLNNGMAVFEMGPVSTPMERALVRFFATAIALPDGADGVFTSGGSAGNLTALLAARQARAGFDAWAGGAHAGPPLCVLTSEQSHYSIARATQIMGWGAGGVQPVPVDERFRMRPDALPAALAAARAAGRRPIAVVAAAASTATGAFDPLPAIADFCAANDLWLHVDGAHGASAALAPLRRALVDGIERADSVVWDAHKMMMMPALVTAVLFRDARASYGAFAQQASYLFDERRALEWWNAGLRTLECTKEMMALKVWAAIACHGPSLLADHVEQTFARAEELADLVEEAADFELALRPQCNIVCFRHRGQGEQGAALDAIQTRARQRVIESGRFYLVQTRLPAGIHLRCTVMNPLTSTSDLRALLDAIREAAA